MTETLRKVLDNPFLRQSPFKQPHSFHPSSPSHSSYSNLHSNSYLTSITTSSISYTHTPFTTSNTKSNQSFKTNQSIAYKNNQFPEEYKNKIKKTTNPFFRKNLIQTKNVQEYFFDILPIKMYPSGNEGVTSWKNTVNRIDSNTEHLERRNSESYQDLSYKTPPSESSVQYMTLSPKRQSRRDSYNKENNQTSPRFSTLYSNKHIEVSKLDLRSPQSPNRYPPSYGRDSNRNIIKQSSYRDIPQTPDVGYHETENSMKLIGERKKLEIPDDEFPKQIRIRGLQYLRNAVQKV